MPPGSSLTLPWCPAQPCRDCVFRLGAGSGQMLWFNFDGAVKGWELIMWQAQTPGLAVQPQTAGAEPL